MKMNVTEQQLNLPSLRMSVDKTFTVEKFVSLIWSMSVSLTLWFGILLIFTALEYSVH